jgi:transcriptional regulator with XRE-family HTH domain
MSMNVRALKELRRKAGLTQENLAHLAGISTSLLAKIEIGRGNPTALTIRKIAQGLSKSLGLPVNTVLIQLMAESEEAPHA